MSKVKCDCGQEYDHYRLVCPSCGLSKYAIKDISEAPKMVFDSGKVEVTINGEKIELGEEGDITIEAPEITLEDETSSELEAKPISRDELKAELDKLGVEYKSNTSTKKLIELLNSNIN